jgi:hypothetical protein
MLTKKVETKIEEKTSRSYPGLKTEYRLFRMYAMVEGLNRDSTGMRFTTEEKGRWDGSRFHVWEWRKVKEEEARVWRDKAEKVLTV